MLKDICGALLASDVNVKLVQRLRTNIKNAVNVQDVSAGINKKRLVQKVNVYYAIAKVTLSMPSLAFMLSLLLAL
jgi:signal recognition particle GTPase